MPRRTITFLDNAYYHIFNRGIENLKLFQDDQDIAAFQNSLAYYLVTFHEKPVDILARTGLAFNNTFSQRITLFAYALLPGSFHLLIHQADHNAIVKFMQRVGTAYSMYYNKKYQRRGTIFEGRFKTKHIDTDDYLLESTKYLHRLGLTSTASHLEATLSQSKGSGDPERAERVEGPDNPTLRPSEFSENNSDNETMKQSNSEGEAAASPLSSLRFILKSSQNVEPPTTNKGGEDPERTREGRQSDNETMGQSDSTTVRPVTSYQRYLKHTEPGYSPQSYINQAVDPTKALQHLTTTKPGLSYKDYIEGSPNIEWYLGLLNWLQ